VLCPTFCSPAITLPLRKLPIWSGVRARVPAVKASAVAYADKALPKSNSVDPSREGSKTGTPI